jgi:hypothetical protein
MTQTRLQGMVISPNFALHVHSLESTFQMIGIVILKSKLNPSHTHYSNSLCLVLDGYFAVPLFLMATSRLII